MIRALLLLLALCCGGMAAARPVTVTSGEHEGFTRLVFDFGAPVDWRVGRSADGYEMAIGGATPAYDLRGIFNLIGRSRLAAVSPDPQNGNLRLGIACACHAQPFEFRPGIVVIDLRDGPPPKGSSFELALEGSPAPDLTVRGIVRPRARPATATKPYDWLDLALNPPQEATAPSPHIDNTAGLAPLRDILLQQLSRGAAQGVVDMIHPATAPGGARLPDFASAQVRIAGGPEMAMGPTGSVRPELGAEGQACIAGERLAFAQWGTDAPVAVQWGPAMSGLTGEFDRTEPEPLARGIRFLLFLGFGAEVRQVLTAFAQQGDETELWRALALILDGSPVEGSVLAGQMACDGPAALWSFLAQPRIAPGEIVNAAAVRLAFSELPLHLRRHLGPPLAERFLALGDTESARAVQDAILRAGGEQGGEIALMQADLAAQTGNSAAAEAHIRSLIDQPGPETADAMTALVELRARQGLPLDPAMVPALEASLAERAGTDAAPIFRRALTLARAASGDPAGAFAALSETPDVEPALWSLLAGLGTDGQLLDLAILPQGATPSAPVATREALARRLLDLGFADAAALWLAATQTADPLLQARVDLATDDPRAALRILAGRQDPDAQSLRLDALNRLGATADAAETLRSTGQDEDATRTLARAGDWASVADSTPSTWQILAQDALMPPAEPAAAEGPLANGHRLTEAAGTTRAAVSALLAETPSPGLAGP